MQLFPHEAINLSISKNDAINRLNNFIEAGSYKFSGTPKWYKGKIKDDSFEIKRTYYLEHLFSFKKKETQKVRSNQSYYITKGSVITAPLGSEIQLEVRLSKWFHVFMFIMATFPFIFLYWAGADKLGIGLTDLLKAFVFVCIPVVMIFYASFILYSRKEMKIVKKDIEEFFEKEVIRIC